MISLFLLNKVVYNGDALSRLKIQEAYDETHDYYTVGIRGSIDIADIIREYNIVRVTVQNDVIKASGNIAEWKWLLHLLKPQYKMLADNLEAVLPLNKNANNLLQVRR